MSNPNSPRSSTGDRSPITPSVPTKISPRGSSLQYVKSASITSLNTAKGSNLSFLEGINTKNINIEHEDAESIDSPYKPAQELSPSLYASMNSLGGSSFVSAANSFNNFNDTKQSPPTTRRPSAHLNPLSIPQLQDSSPYPPSQSLSASMESLTLHPQPIDTSSNYTNAQLANIQARRRNLSNSSSTSNSANGRLSSTQSPLAANILGRLAKLNEPVYQRQSVIDSLEQSTRFLVNNELIKECGHDAEGRLIVSFFACQLPDPKLVDYETLLSLIIERLTPLVASNYILIIFAAGTLFTPSWGWLYKAYSQLDRSFKKNLKQLYIINPTLLTKWMLTSLATIASPKFAKKINWLNSLYDLNQHIDINKIPSIPDPVIKADMQKKNSNIQGLSQPNSSNNSPSSSTTNLSQNGIYTQNQLKLQDNSQASTPNSASGWLSYLGLYQGNNNLPPVSVSNLQSDALNKKPPGIIFGQSIKNQPHIKAKRTILALQRKLEETYRRNNTEPPRSYSIPRSSLVSPSVQLDSPGGHALSESTKLRPASLFRANIVNNNTLAHSSGLSSNDIDSLFLPLALVECISVIVRDDYINTEGIFRKSPSSQVVNRAKSLWDNGVYVTFYETDDIRAKDVLTKFALVSKRKSTIESPDDPNGSSLVTMDSTKLITSSTGKKMYARRARPLPVPIDGESGDDYDATNDIDNNNTSRDSVEGKYIIDAAPSTESLYCVVKKGLSELNLEDAIGEIDSIKSPNVKTPLSIEEDEDIVVATTSLSTSNAHNGQCELIVGRDIPIEVIETTGVIHVACALLKTWLRELPRPLFGKHMYIELNKLEEIKGDQRDVRRWSVSSLLDGNIVLDHEKQTANITTNGNNNVTGTENGLTLAKVNTTDSLTIYSEPSTDGNSDCTTSTNLSNRMIDVDSDDSVLLRLRLRHAKERILPLMYREEIRVCRVLFAVLDLVRRNSDNNKMTVDNLLIIFGPNLIRSEDPLGDTKLSAATHGGGLLIQLAIEHWDILFNGR